MIGGPPCQGFIVKEGRADHNNQWADIMPQCFKYYGEMIEFYLRTSPA